MVELEKVKSWVSGWVKANFYDRAFFRRTAGDKQSGVLSGPDGFIDTSFLFSTALKALFKTYFDTLYGALATTNTWLGLQRLFTGVTNEYTTEQVVSIGDITRFQVLTIDLTAPSGTEYLSTLFSVCLGRDAAPSVYGVASGFINYKGTGASTYVLLSYDISFECAGTESYSITSITGGVRITLSSSDYTNTLNTNMVWLKTTGYKSQLVVVTVTIT